MEEINEKKQIEQKEEVSATENNSDTDSINVEGDNITDKNGESVSSRGNGGGGGGGNWGELHRIFSDMVRITYKMHGICYKKLQECYQEKEITLPIDIEMVARRMNVKIEYENLNYGNRDSFDRNIAQLCYEKEEGEIIQKIVLDNSESKKKTGPLSDLEKYAVAYELGKTIVREKMPDKESNLFMLNLKSRPYALPRLSAQLENFEYEMCAIFLLLPMELFLEEFESYVEEIKEHPILMDNWIKHLSEKAKIPNYQLINGYQYIKFVAYQYYKDNLEKDVKGKDYRELYN